jgi:hypothetical protein
MYILLEWITPNIELLGFLFYRRVDYTKPTARNRPQWNLHTV